MGKPVDLRAKLAALTAMEEPMPKWRRISADNPPPLPDYLQGVAATAVGRCPDKPAWLWTTTGGGGWCRWNSPELQYNTLIFWHEPDKMPTFNPEEREAAGQV